MSKAHEGKAFEIIMNDSSLSASLLEASRFSDWAWLPSGDSTMNESLFEKSLRFGRIIQEDKDFDKEPAFFANSF